ncbi:WD40 repeat-like protein [Hortaea werneckii]|nr:WD40 repeat-like protein [Hortaea werneckii]KAI7007295.1 WD40 repeat-like protein [Hortaea werneckii]KAI7675126.1 WD40 repeat-like protein [Hortaea werneckii]
MSFQQQGGGGNGPGGQGEPQGPHGTEYTLQGVMRFLQIEWHAHERARNSWDIERAEMKAKIAKQEGEVRHAKRINEQLERQVKMLEMVLKNERKKNQSLANGVPPEHGQEKQGEQYGESKEKGSRLRNGETDADGKKTGATAPSNAPHSSFLETSEELSASQTEAEREQYLDNTTKYLKHCMKEIQYLLTPPQHPPPPQLLPNGNYTGLPDAPLSVEDIYVRNARQREMRQRESLGGGQSLPQPTSMQGNAQQPLGGLPAPGEPQQGYREYAGVEQQAAEGLTQQQQPAVQQPQPYEEPAEVISPQQTQTAQEPDGWTFEDDPQQQAEGQQPSAPDMQMSRRPDTDLFPSAGNANHLPTPKSPPRGPGSHRRKSSGSQGMSRRRSSQGKATGLGGEARADEVNAVASQDPTQFKVKFALRGHLDVVRSVIFTGGGSPSEPEVCTAGDDGTIKRWIIPASSYQNYGPSQQYQQHSQVSPQQLHSSHQPPPPADLDISAYFTHRGHDGVVTSLAACPALPGFSTGGRANGDGWIFSGGQDATIRVWERGRVDPKACLEGHTDAIWSVCLLPQPVGVIFAGQPSLIASYGGPERLVLVSGSADGTLKVWAVSAPPTAPGGAQGGGAGGAGAGTGGGSRSRGVGGSRRHSVTSGSNFPSSPQPSVASNTPFAYTLIHTISRPQEEGQANATFPASPTSIAPLSPNGETFVVGYSDSAVLVFDARTGEEVIGMASNETYDGTPKTGINAVVATSLSLEGAAGSDASGRGTVEPAEDVGVGATGGREGVEGVVISGHEDRFVRFFDANSGQCTYNMLAHPSAIASLSLSKDGREAVSAGHDASIRFWSLEKRICTQDIVSHRPMRGEGVCCVAWSGDGRLVVSGGGDGVGKVFVR